MQPEVICKQIMVLGEGPLWHPMEKCLYWVDIVAATLYRLNNDGKIDKFTMPNEICSIASSAKGGLIAALSDRFVTIDTITGTTQNIAFPLQGEKKCHV
ncbi:SMP-30/gluconolactonase/LRE family protein [Rickettsiella endosymbiont of Miltochrista miniata]|uniref:SMP-30/gluconolactonase/LRE family protein n=1 Tax=Rickettsiella endosymbiont of Miltochrista miniata TaxID=3066239 RepID=UPI00313F31C7